MRRRVGIELMDFHNSLQTNIGRMKIAHQACREKTANTLQLCCLCAALRSQSKICRYCRLEVQARLDNVFYAHHIRVVTQDSLNSMTHAQRLRTLFSAGLLTSLLTQALPPARAQTAAPPVARHTALTGAQLGNAPTRMQRCQIEISGLDGRARTLALRECLINRAEGERLIARDCARQYRNLPTGQAAADKNAFQKQCVAGALNVAHKELPKRKPAAPKITADAAAEGGGSLMPVSAPATTQ